MRIITFIVAVIGLTFTIRSEAQTANSSAQRAQEDAKEHLQANQSIDFYGQVVDQTGAAVKGAKADVTVFSWFDPSAKGSDYEQQEENYLLTTDNQGRLELRNKKGTHLEIRLRPTSGYLYSASLPWQFNFDPAMDHIEGLPLYHPDSQHPAIFRVWKVQGGETVVKWGKGERLNQDGTPVGIDLLAGKLRPSDHPAANFRLEVRAEFPADMGSNRIDRYRWTCHLEALNGSLAVSNDDYMFLAPESGYVPKADFIFDPSEQNWDFQKTIKFYYRTADGKHTSRVVLELRTRSGEAMGVFSVSSVTNLTGSRNLEEGRVLQSWVDGGH